MMRASLMAAVVLLMTLVPRSALAADYRYVGSYFLPAWCQDAGELGVEEGRWDAYLCRLQGGGLPFTYGLYVTP